MNSYVSHRTPSDSRPNGYVTSATDTSQPTGYITNVAHPDHTGSYIDADAGALHPIEVLLKPAR